MKKGLLFKTCQMIELLSEKKYSAFFQSFRELLFCRSEMVVCKKDLTSHIYLKNNELNHKQKIIELKPNKRFKVDNYQFPSRSRAIKAARYFSSGYGCFAVVNGNQIIGDLWYVVNGQNKITHPHLKWCGFQLESHHAYMFDMYIVEQARGSGLHNELLNFAFQKLRKNGIKTVYGSYLKNNLPALWMHRAAGYEELFQIKIYRFLFFHWAKKQNK